MASSLSHGLCGHKADRPSAGYRRTSGSAILGVRALGLGLVAGLYTAVLFGLEQVEHLCR